MAICAVQAQQASISLPPVQAELAREALEAKCRHAADLRLAEYALGGAAVVGAGALAVVYVAPVTVRRRRRRHELAHVRHRDVALAWLARSAWYALAPLLILPVAVSLLSSDHSILADLLWRAALLGLTVLLVSAALLRSREHDADLRAAQIAGDTRPLAALLRRAPRRPERSRLRQLVARHPTPDQRIAVLHQPERAADVTVLDGFSSAFLAGLLFPLVSTVVLVIFTGSGRTDLGDTVAAPLATLTAVAGFLVLEATLGAHLSVHFAVTVAQAPLGLGLLFGLTAALAGLIPRASRSPQRTAPARIGPARIGPVRLLGAFALPAVCAAAVSTLLIVGRGAVVGPPDTLISASSEGSPVLTAARLDGLRYLNATAPASEAAYAPVQRSITAASEAATPALAAAIIRTEVLPQLRHVLQYTESIHPGTPQLDAINRNCVTAFQDAITAYTLFARAFQNLDTGALARAKAGQRAASAAWNQWQAGLLSLRLGGGLPATP